MNNGTYKPCVYNSTDRSILFLGEANTLYYPQPKLTDPDEAYDADTNPYLPVTIGAFRAYFQLNGLMVGDPKSTVRSFVLNFDDESTGITDAEANSKPYTLNSTLNQWYSLDGRRVSNAEANSTPSTLHSKLKKGVYVVNGRKVVIK